MAFSSKSIKNKGQSSAGIYLSWLGHAPQALRSLFVFLQPSFQGRRGWELKKALDALATWFISPLIPPRPVAASITTLILEFLASPHYLSSPLQELADFPLIPPPHILLDFLFSPWPARLILLSDHSDFCLTSFSIPVSAPQSWGHHNPQPPKFGFTHKYPSLWCREGFWGEFCFSFFFESWK